VLTSLLLAGAAVGGLAVHGTFHRNSPVFGRVLRRAAGPPGAVALTFDDGPNPRATAAILDTLRAERVPATFFLLGRHVERWPELARRVADEGHAVGNHGYHHRKLHLRGPAYVRTDIALGTDAITAATGASPRLFRAPHGFRSPWVSAIAREFGQQTVGWTLGVWDSARPGPHEIVRRSEALHEGGILLLHDGDGYDSDGDRMQTAEALPAIIAALRGRGFHFVALS
jgi:peptidoglycan/xylan/chitin deacetylase (PgdA/CDA1 family)